MKEFTRAIYEHLITKRKYNKLQVKLDVKTEEYEKKVNELNTERRVHTIQKNTWETKLTEQEREIIELKKEIKNLKSRKKREGIRNEK